MPNKEDRYSYPPRGMSREVAARYIGVGETTFDKLVAEGRMPKPKRIGSRVIWDRHEIEACFEDLEEENSLQRLVDASRGAKTHVEQARARHEAMAKYGLDAFLQASRRSTVPQEDLGTYIPEGSVDVRASAMTRQQRRDEADAIRRAQLKAAKKTEN